MDKILTKDITVNRLLKASFGYGVVLSGKALHLENRCKDYLKKNRRAIIRLIEMNTKEIEVSCGIFKLGYHYRSFVWSS